MRFGVVAHIRRYKRGPPCVFKSCPSCPDWMSELCGKMEMVNNTTWTRMYPPRFTVKSYQLVNSTVAYKQAALNAIAYLQKVSAKVGKKHTNAYQSISTLLSWVTVSLVPFFLSRRLIKVDTSKLASRPVSPPHDADSCYLVHSAVCSRSPFIRRPRRKSRWRCRCKLSLWGINFANMPTIPVSPAGFSKRLCDTRNPNRHL